ncbi:MAG TPA: zinc ribbon domain-containing protein [Longimicrobiales bacterium]|nr:zinc ribbon domain-containing protein [Longimicrobiales bacterium]
MKCPSCGAQTQGKFCAECGAALEGAKCPSCQAKLLPGAKYCTQCGTATRGGARKNAPWYIAGGALLVLIIILLVPILRGGESTTNTPAPTMQPPAGGDGMPALSGNMRENADRLFNRVMQARESGDTARAKFFVPMAIQAYQGSGELDADGLYHLSTLQTFSGDAAGGRTTADQILSSNPTHLLGLSAAAAAARAQNDQAAARRYYEQLLTALPTERTKSLTEYEDHAQIIPEIEAEAKRFLGR